MSNAEPGSGIESLKELALETSQLVQIELGGMRKWRNLQDLGYGRYLGIGRQVELPQGQAEGVDVCGVYIKGKTGSDALTILDMAFLAPNPTDEHPELHDVLGGLSLRIPLNESAGKGVRAVYRPEGVVLTSVHNDQPERPKAAALVTPLGEWATKMAELADEDRAAELEAHRQGLDVDTHSLPSAKEVILPAREEVQPLLDFFRDPANGLTTHGFEYEGHRTIGFSLKVVPKEVLAAVSL